MHFWIDPVKDPRWEEFVNRHPDSSIFHTPEWLSVLQQTYGYAPAAITTSPPGSDLTNGIPFCSVHSVFTGTRLVSLPFSDHCRPLAVGDELSELIQAIRETSSRDRLKYIELRPPESSLLPGVFPALHSIVHILDLSPSLNDIIRGFHSSCVRRKIRRAEREGLTIDVGRSKALLDDFYNLQVVTRRRHGLPPQPQQWFRNLLATMGEKATIRVARLHDRPIAAILILRHKQTAVYKYGCSLASENRRGGMQLLLCRAIEEAKAQGIREMDLGRCGIKDIGLAKFKERWGAERREMAYFRYPEQQNQTSPRSDLFTRLPKPVLITIGRMLYRHLA